VSHRSKAGASGSPQELSQVSVAGVYENAHIKQKERLKSLTHHCWSYLSRLSSICLASTATEERDQAAYVGVGIEEVAWHHYVCLSSGPLMRLPGSAAVGYTCFCIRIILKKLSLQSALFLSAKHIQDSSPLRRILLFSVIIFLNASVNVIAYKLDRLYIMILNSRYSYTHKWTKTFSQAQILCWHLNSSGNYSQNIIQLQLHCNTICLSSTDRENRCLSRPLMCSYTVIFHSFC